MTRNRPIYSIRTSLGRELWWTTSRKKAIELAASLGEGDFVGTQMGGDAKPLRSHDMPVAVYKSSVVKARA